MRPPLLREIQIAVSRRNYVFTLHATRQAERRHIRPQEVEEAILAEIAEIIEDYPGDPRGGSCLVLGWTVAGRPLHVQVTHPPIVFVVTVYEPDPDEWVSYRIRKG